MSRPVPRDPAPGGTARWTSWSGVVAVGLGAVGLGVVGAQALVGAGDLPSALATAQGRTVGPALIAVVAVLVVAERLWPAVPRTLLARAHLVDAAYLALFAVVVVPLLTLVETGFAVETSRHAHFLIVGRLPVVPQVLVVAITLVGIDAMNWMAHVANHRSVALWTLHALHHSQEDMSVLTTFRTHPLLHATYALSLLPALMLSASGAVPATALIAYGCLVTLPHANLRWTLGPLGRVFVSPAYHRLHHARDGGGRGAVNFGFVLVCWDQLAGRAAYPDASGPVVTGLSGRPVPVEQDETRTVARTLVEQLIQPFRLVSATDSTS